jgi:hypothetical protein
VAREAGNVRRAAAKAESEHSRSGLILSSGNVTAWDGPDACRKVADIVVNKLKKVRATPEEEKRKKDEDRKKKEGAAEKEEPGQ